SSLLPHPPTSTLFPYTTLFRSFAALATLHGGTITLNNISRSTRQGDFRFFELCERLGASLTYTQDTTTITGPLGGKLRAITHPRSEEHTSELQSRENLVCRLLL